MFLGRYAVEVIDCAGTAAAAESAEPLSLFATDLII